GAGRQVVQWGQIDQAKRAIMFSPFSDAAPGGDHVTSFPTMLRRSLIAGTVIALLILIPSMVGGFNLKSVLLTFGSSYSISVASAFLLWALLRWSVPLAARRGWPPIRAWAIASMSGGLIANAVYCLVFGFFFVAPGNRLAFMGFWAVVGVVLSIITTIVFFAVERVQADLRRGREAQLRNAVLAQELQLARAIQERLLPDAPPEIGGLSIAGGCYPAREVGGDLLSYQVISGGGVCISVGDVTGKSVGAAMLMGVTLGALQAEIHDHEEPAYVLGEVDRWLRSKNQGKRFVALSIALINPERRTLTLANAGQLAPILRRGQEVRYIEVPVGLPLGMGPAALHDQDVTQLHPGDVLVFYTDGVVEAQNAAGEMWGFERLIARIRAAPEPVAAHELVDAIRAALEGHAAGAEQHDDITLVVVRVI
ncbi:MAG TPA: PP2C family protein-serine/threonine phosphatase, partial [Herpetosiphonaceae bacterium]|nr:PP2C family protein-serine/threonine phosphatase [Herpetosiphonaceae bacterium]